MGLAVAPLRPMTSPTSSRSTPTTVAAAESSQPTVEEIVVDWNGPDDPENPKNWSRSKKWAATAVVSAFTLISPVSSSMIAPASQQVAQDFGITNDVVVALVTSIFVLAYALGPLFLGPLSEIFGRNKVIQLANLFYLLWNFVCGFAKTTPQLLVFRFLAGLGGSAPLAIGGGVLGDIWSPEERGQALAIYSLAPLLGPVVGPVCGAFIAQKSTWRWVFWSTSAFTVGVQLLGLFYLRESYAPYLLEQKAKRLRRSLAKDSEKGTVPRVRSRFANPNRTWKTIIYIAVTRPVIMFYHEPILQLLGIYMAFIYGLFYLFLTSMPLMFQGVYHQSVEISGLHYFALGLGVTGASQINARVMDRIYRRLKEKNGGVGEPEFRLPSMYPGTICTPVGLLITGWSVQNHTHWVVPDIGIALVGAGIILNFQSIQMYVVDVFVLHAASALAAASCLRSLCGFGFPLFAQAMYKHLGYGKGDTILAVIGIAIGCPAPLLFWKYGKHIRMQSKFAKEFAQRGRSPRGR
ncbi:MFS polyamine transporter [Mycena indigotica]|uniref:MFS polyamine transporter n=1 Tax=Mycena indigotica TaxID=2126181 RepID=A0A8H6TA46_9AGAR|nr:MFS polyamine transporter [Mycena indigotica]KAF7312747.1 MFS polyamine transporter [Mycena indigotica]